MKELASACDMDDCEVDAFIRFHQTLGDLISYLPSNGERCIITNPQWLMDRFRELVSPDWCNKAISRVNRHNPQRNKGIVSTENLTGSLEEDMMLNFSSIL